MKVQNWCSCFSKQSCFKSSDDSDGDKNKISNNRNAYLAPEPGAKKFIEIGDKIKKGQTVMIVEAMKTMNHVPSTSDGEVKKILLKMVNLLSLVKL